MTIHWEQIQEFKRGLNDAAQGKASRPNGPNHLPTLNNVIAYSAGYDASATLNAIHESQKDAFKQYLRRLRAAARPPRKRPSDRPPNSPEIIFRHRLADQLHRLYPHSIAEAILGEIIHERNRLQAGHPVSKRETEKNPQTPGRMPEVPPDVIHRPPAQRRG